MRSKSALRLGSGYGMTNSPWSEAADGLRVKRRQVSWLMDRRAAAAFPVSQ